MKISAHLTIALAVFTLVGSVHGENIQISGIPWPIIEAEAPTHITGQHPIYGTIVCPALVESSLSAAGVSAALLRELPKVHRDGDKISWSFQINRGLSWWSGETWQSGHLVEFFKSNLAEIVRVQSGGAWPTPSFQADADADKGAVILKWSSAPKFGPGILANWPIFRPLKAASAGSLKYECLGKFKVENLDAEKLELRSGAVKISILHAPTKNKDPQAQKFLRFRMAGNFGGSPWVRMSDEPIDCKQRIEVPNFLVLSWNTKLWPTNIPELRKILTQLSPRGELLRSGAGSLGDLVSGPILRTHPGYNKSILVRPFSLADSVRELEGLGFKRPTPDRARQAADGRELKLRIQVDEGLNGLIEKVVFDSFYSVGVPVDRAKASDSADEIHGRLSSIFVISRQFDWFPILKSSGHSNVVLSLPDDHQLHDFAEKYSISLTDMSPKFDFLRSFHQRLYELEPMAILMHNRACIDSNFKINASLLDSAAGNPRWLINILGIDSP